MTSAERITILRRRCLERKHRVNWMDTTLASAASLRASEKVASWQVRRGLLARDRLAAVTLAVDDLELLMGRLAPPATAPSPEETAAAQAYLSQYSWPGGQTGHCELDRGRLFRLGVDGMCAEIRERLAGTAGETADAYRSFLHALDGFTALLTNAARTAESAKAVAAAERQSELEAMAACCRKLAHRPPATFREALQLLWFADFAVTLADGAALIGPGHLDRTLRPFYAADLAAGRITPDDALLLLEQFYLLLNEFIPDGLAIPVMVGGRDATGQDVTNDISHLCLEALRRTRLVYPTVGICWHPGTPGTLTDLAVELIGKGFSNPAFFGDDTIQRGLRELGVPAGERCNYINSTCVEITPVGASNVWVASPYFPLCRLLLEEIAAQVEPGQAAPTFPAFLRGYQTRLGAAIAAAVAVENNNRATRRQHGGKPLQSVFTRDCIERGRDIDNGGAVYNWVECSFVGLANLADSLHVIREEVYRRKRRALADLKTMLDSDFCEHEAERLRFLRHYPKYGNGCAAVDTLVGRIVRVAQRECARHRLAPDDSPFVPGTFCWIMHEQLGRQCGATPDGRRAGVPFADGAGPAQGREKNGPTAAILSTTSWDHAPLIGGLAYNMKFSGSMFTSPEAFARLRDLIVTFLRRGGFETQVNVVDHEVLEKARANPEEYRDLVVRIGGYTDYFTRLSPAMQTEVMQRTEFDLTRSSRNQVLARF